MKRAVLVLVIVGAWMGCGEPTLLDVDSGSPQDAGAAVRAIAIRTLEPDRGSYRGGTRAVLRGAGFAEGDLVRVDGTVVDPARVERLGGGVLVLTMPPHTPGTVDVEVRGPAGESASLADAFTYDALSVTPDFGSTEGGRRIALEAFGFVFEPGDEVTVGGGPCGELRLGAPSRASCRVPPSPVGRVDVAVLRGGEAQLVASGAFEYVESDLTYGGITGPPLDGRLEVEVLTLNGSQAGATVYVVGQDGTWLETTGPDGRVVIEDPALQAPVAIHAGYPCAQRTSLLAVTASQVAVPLGPYHQGDACPTPDWAEPVPRVSARVEGVLQFYDGVEFRTPVDRVTRVPSLRDGERYAAVSPTYEEMTVDLTYDAAQRGFPFHGELRAGVHSLCFVAGIQPVGGDPDPLPPPPIDPYVGGCATVSVGGDRPISGVVVPMDVPLTEHLTLTLEPLASRPHYSTGPGTSRRATDGAAVDTLGALPPIVAGGTSERAIVPPSTVTLSRMPPRAAWPLPSPFVARAIWGETPARSQALYVAGTSEETTLTPLAIPELVSPAAGAALARATPFRVSSPGATLVQLFLAPSTPHPDGGTAPWRVLGPGSAVEGALPDASVHAIFARPDDDYRLDVTAFELRDHDWASFNLAERLAIHRVANNRTFFRWD